MLDRTKYNQLIKCMIARYQVVGQINTSWNLTILTTMMTLQKPILTTVIMIILTNSNTILTKLNVILNPDNPDHLEDDTDRILRTISNIGRRGSRYYPPNISNRESLEKHKLEFLAQPKFAWSYGLLLVIDILFSKKLLPKTIV